MHAKINSHPKTSPPPVHTLQLLSPDAHTQSHILILGGPFKDGLLAFALYSAYSAYHIFIYPAANFAVSTAALSTRNKLANDRGWKYICTTLFEPGLPLFRTCSPVSNSPSTTVLQQSSLTAGER
jgi:hypothetical protein